MKLKHPTDDFLLSETAFLNAGGYWHRLFHELGVLPCEGWMSLNTSRLVDGSIDTGGGVLLTLTNVSVRKTLRFSQSPKMDVAFLLAHLSEREVEGTECVQLSIHCSPNERIEGLIVLLTLAWLKETCTPASMQSILDRLLKNEMFEDI